VYVRLFYPDVVEIMDGYSIKSVFTKEACINERPKPGRR
jgi:hypothetical protein